ncbi:MAG: DUF2188 domain-containing protein [Thermoplasmata archaeon]|nr:DUF2188 domain-containing protein [Thermoplasmata archaeon]
MGLFSKKKEEPKPEAKKAAPAKETKPAAAKKETKPAAKTETKPAAKKEPAKKESSSNGAYFVSPHPDGGWQVKKANAQKALKIFKTKAEAEKYAKTVADNQDSHVVRQKKDGKIQKKH